jgi:hypothetical protein
MDIDKDKDIDIHLALSKAGEIVNFPITWPPPLHTSQ